MRLYTLALLLGLLVLCSRAAAAPSTEPDVDLVVLQPDVEVRHRWSPALHPPDTPPVQHLKLTQLKVIMTTFLTSSRHPPLWLSPCSTVSLIASTVVLSASPQPSTHYELRISYVGTVRHAHQQLRPPSMSNSVPPLTLAIPDHLSATLRRPALPTLPVCPPHISVPPRHREADSVHRRPRTGQR